MDPLIEKYISSIRQPEAQVMQVDLFFLLRVSGASCLIILYSFLFGMGVISGCSGVQPQPEIVTITDDEAEQDAKAIVEESIGNRYRRPEPIVLGFREAAGRSHRT